MTFHINRRSVLSAIVAAASLAAGGCGENESTDTTGLDNDTACVEQAVAQSISATLSVYTSWADGYCANVTVKNTSSVSITNWAIIIQINPAGISTIWEATPTMVGVPEYRQLVAQPKSSNATLAPNASTQFGYCGLGPSSTATVIAAQGFN
jgi:endo-1,4-beta-xylanase